jgi:hypothetical protein
MSKYRNITKLSSPGSSSSLDYVVNIYKDGNFRLAYRYKGWSGTAVEEEIKFLKARFPDYQGWKIEW